MLTGRSDGRFLSQPCEVHFAGFRSDTFTLQQAGWALSAEQDIRSRTIRLAMRFEPARLYMVSQSCPFEYFDGSYGGHYRPVFNVHHCSSNMMVQLHETKFDFRPIDATPRFVETPIKSIEDLGIFATPLTKTEEIIVEPATVASLLEQIKSLQAPDLAEIRERNRHRSAADGRIAQTTYHAQIVSIAA